MGKEDWDGIKEEFQGSEKTEQMQILNLRREFEVLRMNDSGSMNDFMDRVMKVVNRVRLLGEELTDKRVVEKLLISLPERFKAKLSSLEDFSKITLVEIGECIASNQVKEIIKDECDCGRSFCGEKQRKFQGSMAWDRIGGKREMQQGSKGKETILSDESSF